MFFVKKRGSLEEEKIFLALKGSLGNPKSFCYQSENPLLESLFLRVYSKK